MKHLPLVLLPALLLATAACTTFDADRTRRDQTDAFRADLAEKQAALLAAPLSLDDCLRIAMTNSYAARKADLDTELARLGRNTAFSAFLPQVSISSGYTARDYANISGQTSGGEMVMGPKRDSSTSLSAGLPLFMPSTWFLYAATRHGYAAAALAAHYVRQNLVLQVTSQYCDVLVQQDTIEALRVQLDAARQLSDRLSGLADEGFVAGWERDQAALQVVTRQTELDRAVRQLALLRATLLQTLGLAPDAPIVLSGDLGDQPIPPGTLADHVLLALASSPQLSLADRQVVIKEHAVRQAFCDFLPTLSVSATHLWGGENLAFEALGWQTGFSAAWNVFKGFANVSAYKSAKVERRQSELERENTFLSVIVSVISAENALQDADAARALRQQAYDVAAAKSADRDARAAEGLIPLSDALDARAEKDLAQVALLRSTYASRLAACTLNLALGQTLLPGEEPPAPAETPAEEPPAPAEAPAEVPAAEDSFAPAEPPLEAAPVLAE
ncbi:MAG: TolC family protein [Kiritimatiellae bacterium]|nr:TolC family protein [Kiritimatiellia bacterium]